MNRKPLNMGIVGLEPHHLTSLLDSRARHGKICRTKMWKTMSASKRLDVGLDQQRGVYIDGF
jgi:hypothetical protein